MHTIIPTNNVLNTAIPLFSPTAVPPLLAAEPTLCASQALFQLL